MSPPQWCVPRAADFLIRDWDADGVLYDVASGDTHRLGALHLELIELLQRKPGAVEDLQQSLAADLPEHLSADEQRQLIAKVLGELAGLNLIDTSGP
jgi:PqqD family protein of HPr-rel-A system